jgi:hypothetical protein
MDAKDVEDAFFRYEGDLLELSERALSESRSARLHLLRAGAARIFGLAPDPLTELAAARDLPCDPVDDSLASALELFSPAGRFATARRKRRSTRGGRRHPASRVRRCRGPRRPNRCFGLDLSAVHTRSTASCSRSQEPSSCQI